MAWRALPAMVQAAPELQFGLAVVCAQVAFVMRVFLVVETTVCVVLMMVWLLLWPRCKGGEGV